MPCVYQLWLELRKWRDDRAAAPAEQRRIDAVRDYCRRCQPLDAASCGGSRFQHVLGLLKEPRSRLLCIQDVHDLVFPKHDPVAYTAQQLDDVARPMLQRMELIVRYGGEPSGAPPVPEVYAVDPRLVRDVDRCLAGPVRGGLADVLTTYVEEADSEDEHMALAVHEP